MKDWEIFGEREEAALNDFLVGRSLDDYEDAVLRRVLWNVSVCRQLVIEAVKDGKAPLSAAQKVGDDGARLVEILQTRREKWAAKWKAANPKAVAKARALAARALRPRKFWERIWS